MKNIKTFENFNDPVNDPNHNPVVKVQISSYITKSDFFAMKNKKEKDFIKKSAGKEFETFKKNEHGDYIIETGDKEIKELLIPKKFIYEINKKSS